MSEAAGSGLDRWHTVENLFHEALAIEAAQRENFLATHAKTDRGLTAEVLALLESNAKISSLVIAQGSREERSDGADRNWEATDPWIGRRVGAFELSELLGQGGMGRVYRGERCEGAFEQTVAVKLMAQLLASPAAQRRFLDERDALAHLEHRNIAGLIDGGITEEGLPFLAMEFVDGRRLDEVCDDQNMNIAGLLRLTRQLCEALGYVHRHLYLHRDLKPGNVLVTREGDVKLLDFGAIKSLASALENSEDTRLGMRALTVRYASPEHIGGKPMSTASDVFSLGMTLYRLLLGHLPPELISLDIDSYLTALREEKLVPFSKQLEERWKVNPTFARDMESIVRKALNFDPAQRYLDADALSADLRCAEEGRPIQAIPTGAPDRALRFLRRHRGATALTLAAILCLTGASTVMVHQEKIVRAERLRAERGLAQESRLNHFLLVDYFEQLKQIPGSTAAQKQAVSEALTYADRLASLADRPDLELDRVQAYTEMGSLLGNPYESNLNDTPDGKHTLEKAVGLSQQLAAAQPGNEEVWQAEAAANHALGQIYFGSGDPHKAEVYLLPAAKIRGEIAATGHADAATLAQAASTFDALEDVNQLDGAITLNRPDEAQRWAEQAQALDAKGLAKDPACARCRRGVALEYWKMGMRIEDPRLAQRLFETGLSTLQAFSPQQQATPRVQRMEVLLRQNVGISELQMGRTGDGLSLLNEMRGRLRKATALDPMDARAQFDLYVLDYNIVEPLDPHQNTALKFEVGREMLASAEALVRLDPNNTQWQIHRAEAQMLLGKAFCEEGDRLRGVALEEQAAATLVPMARQAEADPDVLGEAAHALVLTARDGSLAERFASSAVNSSTHPSPEREVTLAEAQILAKNQEGAAVSAQAALLLLRARPDSVKDRHLTARAEAVLADAGHVPVR